MEDVLVGNSDICITNGIKQKTAWNTQLDSTLEYTMHIYVCIFKAINHPSGNFFRICRSKLCFMSSITVWDQ